MDSVHNDIKKLSLKTFLILYFRSFFLQGSWSQKYRQNLGFAYAMEPVGKELYKDSADYAKFLIRHSKHFNGNPFMVTLVLGAVANMETRLCYNKGVSEEDIKRFKNVVGPATGAVGDRLFWSNLRPFGIILGLLCTVFCGLWGVVIFLAFFNIPTLVLKWHWLNAGYRLGPKVVGEIKNQKLEWAAKTIETLGSVLITFISVVYLTKPEYYSIWFFPGTIGMFIFTAFMLKHGIPLHIVFPLSLAVAVLLGVAMSFVI